MSSTSDPGQVEPLLWCEAALQQLTGSCQRLRIDLTSSHVLSLGKRCTCHERPEAEDGRHLKLAQTFPWLD